MSDKVDITAKDLDNAVYEVYEQYSGEFELTRSEKLLLMNYVEFLGFYLFKQVKEECEY